MVCRDNLHRCVAVLGSILIGLFLTGGGCTDYGMSLPGGYVLIRANAFDISIMDPSGGPGVGPSVDDYRVIGGVITGHVREFDDLTHRETGRAWYFVIDTNRRQVRDRLDEAGWRLALRQLGIEGRPSLKRPSWWDGDRVWQD